MWLVTMKHIWLLSAYVIAVGSQTNSWIPIVGPLFKTYPCQDTEAIMMWFEPGLQPSDNNWFYLYMNNTFPKDSKMTVIFNSQVNITFALRADTDEYVRATLSDGHAFTLIFFEPQGSFGFKVSGTEPGVLPYLQSLSVDNQEYCDDPIEDLLEKYAAKRIIAHSKTCGRRRVEHTELIVSGASTKPGDWPWHAALYKLDKSSIKYICGGTLISKNFVLTAAHCVTYRGARYRTELLDVVLGKYKLIGDDKESVEKEVLEIIVHKNFHYRRLRNDIALLKLSTEVVLNDYIQPACLYRQSDNAKLNTDEIFGTTVGWGFDNTNRLSHTLRQATMPIISEVNCLKSNPLFYSNALNGDTFCAGYHNGTSPCNGDSGSAFQVFIPDETPVGEKETSGSWHVLGIVSNTLSRFDEPICDPEQYVIFTKVENYMDWIDSHLKD